MLMLLIPWLRKIVAVVQINTWRLGKSMFENTAIADCTNRKPVQLFDSTTRR